MAGLFAATLLTLGVDAIRALPPRALKLEVLAPGSLSIGEPGQATLTVTSPRSLRVEMLCELHQDFEPQPAQQVQLERGRPAQVAFTLLARRRGKLSVDEIWARWEGPMGMVRRQLRHAVAAQVPVIPNIRPVRAAAFEYFGTREIQTGVQVERYVGSGSEFDALREYVPGQAVAAVGVLAGCRQFPRIVGSNTIETRDFDFDGFTRVDISHAFTAEIVKADAFAVEVTLNDNLFDYLDISRSGNTLTIKMEAFSSFIHTTQKVKIYMPELVAVSFSGATQGVVTGFDNSNLFDINVSGASRLEINGLKTTGSTYIQVSGASRLSGSLETVDGDFEVSGASVLELTGTGTDIRLDVWLLWTTDDSCISPVRSSVAGNRPGAKNAAVCASA